VAGGQEEKALITVMNILSTDRNKAAGPELDEFTGGIEVDKVLAPQEIAVQKAWARAMGDAGYLTPEECRLALCLLEEALAGIEDGSFEWRAEDEDIHMNLERFMTAKAGDLGKKVHMGRSRNDLIATTLRLHAACRSSEISKSVSMLAHALCDLGDASADAIVPGNTHMQHGQPVAFGHIAAAHASAFVRDLRRLRLSKESCLEYMPLGSAALAGTTLRVDLKKCAKELGFDSPPTNSYDAVGDRDFMIELMDALAQTAIHAARLCEDIIYWSSTAVGLVALPRQYSTGSSIMPNKRNPDVAELARARCARVISLANEAHTILKSVPTSYAGDMHELKKTFVFACDETQAVLKAFTPFVKGLSLNRERAAELLCRGHILATEVADALASRGMPFREAYRKTAALVELAEDQGVQIHELDREDFMKALPDIDTGFLDSISFENAVERRSQPGGTNISNVKESIRRTRQALSSH